MVLPNKWELQNLMDIKLTEEKSYQVDNKYQDNFFFEKLDVVMKDIKVNFYYKIFKNLFSP